MDLNSDMLYLSLDLCLFGSRFHSTFQQDIEDVKMLAVSGIYDRSEDYSRLDTLGGMSQIIEILKAFGNLKLLILIEAEHDPERTADLLMIDVESTEGYEERLRESVILDASDTFQWPRFSVGVYSYPPEYTGWRYAIQRKVDLWKEVLKSASHTRWRLSRVLSP